MSIAWSCPLCGYQTRLASEMVRVLRWFPLLRRHLPGYVCTHWWDHEGDAPHILGTR